MSVLRNADPDGDAKAPAWSRDSRRHAKELTGVSLRMMLAEPVQADKCINRSQGPFVRRPFGGECMNRELALKIVLAVVGLLFIALGYPMVVFIRQDPALSMQFSLYVTLGIFLLLAIRDPSASRSVIAFTAWSSFAHAALMGTQACRNMVARGELIGWLFL